MIIHAIRFREQGKSQPTGYRFRPGSGRFQGHTAIRCEGTEGRLIATAIRYALTGRCGHDKTIIEATIHLSDHSGDTWLVDRNEASVVCLRNGSPINHATQLEALKAALLDRDVSHDKDPSIHVGVMQVAPLGKRLQATPIGVHGQEQSNLNQSILKQINHISQETKQLIGSSTLANPKVMSTLVRYLEPLYSQIQECEKEIQSLGGETHISPAQTEKLKEEIALLEKIAEQSGPIMQPEKRRDGLKQDLATVEASLTELLAQAGLSAPPTAKRVTDWRKPIEALARLEAYAKLIRANQGTKTYLDQNLTPVYQEYLKTIDDVLVRDQVVISELDSCLASLTIQSTNRESKKETTPPSLSRQTWFDRFKHRDEDDDEKLMAPSFDLDGAKLAVEYARGRVTEVGEQIRLAKTEFVAMTDKISQSQEDLVEVYGRLKETWAKTADEFKLPRDISLKQLLTIVVSHTRIVSLADKREALQAEINDQKGRHATLEQLLHEWRALTGSQKQTDISHPTIALSEARDVLRFLANKKERLRKLEETRVAATVSARLTARMKAKLSQLNKQWDKCLQGVVSEGQKAPQLSPHHPAMEEWLANAHMLRGLASLYQGEKRPEQDAWLATPGANTALTAHIIQGPLKSSEALSSLADGLKNYDGTASLCFLVTDEEVFQALQDIGIGVGRQTEDVAASGIEHAPAPTAKPQQPTVAKPPVSPRPTPTLGATPPAKPQPRAPQPTRGQQGSLLSPKAKEALDILTTRRS